MNTLEIIRNGLMQCIEKIEQLEKSVVNLVNRATTIESKTEKNKDLISKVITGNSICALHSIDDGSNMLFEDGIAELNGEGNNGPERYIAAGFPNRITFYRNSKEIVFFNFNTSAVTNMSSMFYYCSGLTTLDVTNFNTSNVTNMSYMFYYCSGLTTLDVTNFNTSNVTNMSYMFSNCSKLTTLDLSNFDTSSVSSMREMFFRCNSLKSIIGAHTLEEVQAGTVKALRGTKVDISFFDSPYLERASILALFNGLADLTGKTKQTISLHSTAKARLTAEDIKIATDKNWNVQ